MMPGINTEIQSAGGGMGGYGFGNGTNPLLWLITLAFLRDGGGLGGNSGETLAASGLARANEGISCLSKGQSDIIAQQQFDRLSDNMVATGNRTVSAVGDLANDFNSFSRDLNKSISDGQLNDLRNTFELSRQIGDCCCETKSGFAGVERSICDQTNILVNNQNNNAQRIVDLITSNKIQELESQLSSAQTAIALGNQTRAIEEFLVQNCNCGRGSVAPVAAPVPAP